MLFRPAFALRNEHGSDGFIALLDSQKAFDRICHYGLFLKLLERGVPLCLLFIIIFWHLNMSCKVKWGMAYSEEFNVPLGTKQGGISSPGYFSIYINDMVDLLRKSGVGCHLINIFIGCILFADDLALLSPSRSALQQMIDICRTYCQRYCLQFNAKKSKVMVIGKTYEKPCNNVTINNVPLESVNEWKYLGTTIKAGKQFLFTARPDISSFFRATNSVLSVLKGAHEHTLMHLLYTNCVPILTYACSVKEYSASDMSDCNTAMNSALRRVFGFTDWRSIRVLRQSFNFKSIYELFQGAKDRFISSCRFNHNPIIRHIVSLTNT